MSLNEHVLPNNYDIWFFNVGDKVVIDFDPTWEWRRPFTYRNGGGVLGKLSDLRFCDPDDPVATGKWRDNEGWKGYKSLFGRTGTITGKDGSGKIWWVLKDSSDDCYYRDTEKFPDNYRTSTFSQCWLRPVASLVIAKPDDKQEKWWHAVIQAWYESHKGLGMIEACKTTNLARLRENPKNNPAHPLYSMDPTKFNPLG